MLTVVDELARIAVGERCRTAAKPRACLEHDDARAGACQPDRRAQSGKTGADDYDVRSHCLNAISA